MSYGAWHKWYAWYPVNTEQHGWRWLKYVARAKHYPAVGLPFAPAPYWCYRPLPTDTKDINT